MHWLTVAQDRDRRRETVNVVWNFGFHKMWSNFWQDGEMLASQEGLWFTDLFRMLDNMFEWIEKTYKWKAVWSVAYRVAEAYQLQLSDVLLPPEVCLVFWPRIRHEIVSVHEHVDKSVYESKEDNMATWKKLRF
jgi:hypothetical protein